ncbi:carboxypeptidase-like regulatory domain-containing protein [Parabacteroides distasonis]|nr:carboxypeptidase-like regulatory domain-containing protein [Parabacteroides distasonis]
MKLTSIPLFVFTTGVYASVHSPNMHVKSDIMMIETPSIVSTPQQNTRQIIGTVIDAAGMPIIGANVMVKGTTNGTITDIDGKFTLEVPKGAILQVSYIGYMNQEIPVGNKSVLSISLQEDTQKLDEVVVIGYGTMKKSDITGGYLVRERGENRSPKQWPTFLPHYKAWLPVYPLLPAPVLRVPPPRSVSEVSVR